MIDIATLERQLEAELRHCRPCGHGAKRMDAATVTRLRGLLPNGWRIVNDRRLKKKFTLPDHEALVAYVTDVLDAGDTARHPACMDICGVACTVEITMYTHRIDGLTAHDWVMAARCDNLHTDTGVLL